MTWFVGISNYAIKYCIIYATELSSAISNEQVNIKFNKIVINGIKPLEAIM